MTTPHSDTWRLLLDPPAEGAWNMAVDEALLLCHADGTTPPTLRFYDWNPPCVSLGRFQDAYAIAGANTLLKSEVLTATLATPEHSKNQIAADTVGKTHLDSPEYTVVRRPTGGRAVLHHHEITYSMVLREALLPPGERSIVGAYRWLSAGFVQGLQSLGVQATLARGETAATNGHLENCFASAARCDFVVEARKLIGAAQCRKAGAVLQHGSLLLEIDALAWHNLVGGPSEAISEKMVSLHDLGVNENRGTIIAALCQGVAQTLGVQLEQGTLSEHEIKVAQGLHGSKYSRPGWILEGR